MAIYTRENRRVLDTKPLDAKNIYNSLSEYNADPYKYNGQIAYIKNAIEYTYNWDSDLQATADALRLSIGTNKTFDIFYVPTSDDVSICKGLNMQLSLEDAFSFYFADKEQIRFSERQGVPNIYLHDVDDYSVTIYSSHIGFLNDALDDPLNLYADYGLSIGTAARTLDYINCIHDMSPGLIIGNSNQLANNSSNQRAIIGTGLIGNGENSVTIGQYNDATNPCLFSVGCGTDNSHRRNALIVNPYGGTDINDATIEYLQINTYIYNMSQMQINYVANIDILGLDVSDPYNSLDIKDPKVITSMKMRINEAFDSAAKLNIFIYSNKTTKTPIRYILQNYPIGQISEGDLVSEDIIDSTGSFEYIGITITGEPSGSNANAKLLLNYITEI